MAWKIYLFAFILNLLKVIEFGTISVFETFLD